ncbi:RNA-binding transcriptional accessory protein [Grimontia hollisae]|uniref:Transcription accessory protein n=1 Tax=Grimontia hollisae CIP 101886 TaxID=675812 RepID=D0I472_GRIHO|nr:Tex family protein [Grimontia hollisae]AMG30515.1 RNA-binding transcriptional accessory protein [Grimontia hollisae]EEY73850.1 transcription accessory protein [Grimontia hollisae CIP 101886]STO41885.1 30S ribosomal protein S1 [Grimontia hollisae]
MTTSIYQQIATELNVRDAQVVAAVNLLDDGNTVPFIARYRKEVTNGLDDTQLRTLESRLSYLRELEDRRQVILKSIDEQGKLTDALKKDILDADSKNRLEDLYLPYKPKRRTKGQIAIEAGIEPLATLLWEHPDHDPETEAANYLNEEAGFADTKAVLDGARAILMEQFAEDAALLDKVRRHLNQNAEIQSRVVAGKEEEGAKFKDYFAHDERLSKVPSHRALAMFRGRNEGILQLSLNADPGQDEKSTGSYCETLICDHYGVKLGTAPADRWRKQVVSFAWRIKILMHMETELMGNLRESAENDAIKVFADNLKDLLMAAPAGPRCTLGIDPGLRTGCKVAVVDATGKLLDTATIYPTPPQNKIAESARVVMALIKKHKVDLIAIGNGTASRETDAFVAAMLKDAGEKIQTVMVSEAGASVYSASELAAAEFPDLDVSLRGAVSIARRLQDPLAELVKIDPKSIGVGQYQHDVSQTQLAKRLDAVVEDCVNAVGVDVNSASAALLTRVAGLSTTMAANIVAFRNENGRFEDRKTLLKVPRLGPKAFEQCAGFLRVMNGKNPLDGSAVHPEAYPVVKRIAEKSGKAVDAMIGNHDFLRTLNAADYADDTFGIPTVTDILAELAKPGRDPRPEFKTATFAEGVNEVKDLIPGMVLEGVITNVTNFGAFVDVGVHQDGLVHISALSDKFISDPRDVVKAGDVVKVKVMEVDLQRKRIGLSMRLSDEPGTDSKPVRESRPRNQDRNANGNGRRDNHHSAQPSGFGGAFADAFANAKRR